MHKFIKTELVKVTVVWLALVVVSILVGCDSIRFAPGQVQKRNAWLHNRTTQMAADTAKAQNSSENLCALTSLSAAQSGAFMADYGLPDKLPHVSTAEDILNQSSFALADEALYISSERPNVWEVADSAMDVGIGIAGLLGGVWGLRIAAFLKQTRRKSKALREIVDFNEIFKRQSPEFASAFKAAHKAQSPKTKTIVTEIKTAGPVSSFIDGS